MLILKIKDKGLYLEIPGTIPTRTPAEINITKCDLSLVSAYLRKNGVIDYQILSTGEIKKSHIPSAPDIKDSSLDQRVVNKRFTQLEKMVTQLIEKDLNEKEIQNKLLTNLINLKTSSQKCYMKKSETQAIKKKDDSTVDKLEDIFIPNIDISSLKLKGKSKTSVNKDISDLDDNVDLLSKIVESGR